MPEQIIRETISVTRTSVSEEDKEISALYNRVVKKGLKHALYILQFGTASEKLRVSTAAMSSAARLAALDSRQEIEEHRAEFERLTDIISDVEVPDRVISGPDVQPQYDFIDAPTQTLAIEPHDQD